MQNKILSMNCASRILGFSCDNVLSTCKADVLQLLSKNGCQLASTTTFSGPSATIEMDFFILKHTTHSMSLKGVKSVCSDRASNFIDPHAVTDFQSTSTKRYKPDSAKKSSDWLRFLY